MLPHQVLDKLRAANELLWYFGYKLKLSYFTCFWAYIVLFAASAKNNTIDFMPSYVDCESKWHFVDLRQIKRIERFEWLRFYTKMHAFPLHTDNRLYLSTKSYLILLAQPALCRLSCILLCVVAIGVLFRHSHARTHTQRHLITLEGTIYRAVLCRALRVYVF